MAVATGPPVHHDNELSVGAFLDIADGFGQSFAGRLIEFFAAHHLKKGKSNTSPRDTEKGSIRTKRESQAAFCVSAVLCVSVSGGEKSFKHTNGPADLLGRCHTGHIRGSLLFTKQLN